MARGTKKSILDYTPLVAPFAASEQWEKDLAKLVAAFDATTKERERLASWIKTVPFVDDGPLQDSRGRKLNERTEGGDLYAASLRVAEALDKLDWAATSLCAAIACASGYEDLKRERLRGAAKELETNLLKMVASGDAKLIGDHGLKIVFVEKPHDGSL